MASSPIPGFHLLPPDVVEKWHAGADIEDPPFKRPMLARMAHMKALEKKDEIETKLRDARIFVKEAEARRRNAVTVSLALLAVASVLAASLFVPQVFVVSALIVCVVAAAPVWRVHALARKEEARCAADKTQLLKYLDDCEKEIAEHWEKFVKLQNEADAKMGRTNDAPVEQK
jgi:hypothetical protein